MLVLADLLILVFVLVGVSGTAVVSLRTVLRSADYLFGRSGPKHGDDGVNAVDVENHRPIEPDLPDPALQERVDRIRSLADGLLRRLAASGSDAELADLRRLRDDHLPHLLFDYLAIPEAHRQDPTAEGSPREQLEKALDAVLAHLREMEDGMSRGDIARFSDSTRFVSRRYGRPEEI